METALLILGNQLFPLSHLKKVQFHKIVMAEDHGLCTHFKYHKHKILFFLSAMRQYKDQLQEKGHSVEYYDGQHKLFKKPFEWKLKDFLKKNPKTKKLTCFAIEDKFFETRIEEFCKKEGLDLEYLETPMFLTSREDFRGHLNGRKRPFMKSFYEWQRKRLKIMLDSKDKPLGGQWSFDKENRKKLPKKMDLPKAPHSSPNDTVLEVAAFVEKTFKDHPGSTKNFWLPTTRPESLSWLKSFVKHRLKNFGDYQDAITTRSDFVFHSVISPMINVGLILPDEVIKAITDAHLKNPDDAPLNATEGFVRQVIGWREFVRGIYQEYSEVQWETNFWKHQRQLKACWYDGTTGIPVLDDCIHKANAYSYNHHIERLMVLSNLMLLSEVHPHQVYAWFMEMNSDSSDWVMGPNVFGMGQFSDGGIFATKPYICGSNYYLKMSDYKKGDWCHTVDGLYWRFIDKHKDFYKKNPRMSVMTKSLEKMDPSRKTLIFSAAEKFIEETTSI